jgi:hypothetical protein
MDKSDYFVLVLPSIHFILRVEKEALQAGIQHELIPTPRQISTDCGMVVKFGRESLDWILTSIDDPGMPVGKLYLHHNGLFESWERNARPKSNT